MSKTEHVDEEMIGDESPDSTEDSSSAPPPDAERPGGNVTFYNISEGQLHYKVDGERVDVEDNKIKGILQSYSIHSNTYEDKKGDTKTIESVEAVLKDENGKICIVQTSLGSTVASGQYMASLISLEEFTGWITIFVDRSPERVNGNYMTFIQIQKFNGKEWVDVTYDKDREDWGGPDLKWKERLPYLEEQFQNSPHYKERKKKSDDEDGESSTKSGMARFQNTLAGKDWPELDPFGDTGDAYLAWINKTLETKHKKLDDIEDKEWDEMRDVVDATKRIPSLIKAAT